MTTIGLIREYKEPPDHRVAMSPQQCRELLRRFPDLRIVVESSPVRCFKDEEYKALGFEVVTDLSDCDVLMGIKEVPVDKLLANKTYLFFSHTIKKQPQNRALLREIVKKNIELIDYECLVWENGSRILGFGHFAGVVGMYNGIKAWGHKFQLFDLKPAYQLKNYLALKQQLSHVKLPAIKIALCGSGRVAHGVLEVLQFMKIREVTPQEFLEEKYEQAVYVHLESSDYYKHKEGRIWDKSDFYHSPEDYISTFDPYTKVCDLMVNAIFWKPGIPIFFTKEDMKDPDFNIKVIADITCDVDGAIPCTVKSTTIEEPVFGWHALTEKITEPYLPHTVDVMAVGNLPCELPADASIEFGESIIKYVVPHLLGWSDDEIIRRATIAKNGELAPKFEYLKDYIA